MTGADVKSQNNDKASWSDGVKNLEGIVTLNRNTDMDKQEI